MHQAVSSAAFSMPARARRLKKALVFGIAGTLLVAGGLVILPTLFDLGKFKNTYLPLVEEALNRKVDVGRVHLNLIPTPSIRLSHLRISDGPASSADSVFAAERVRLQVRLWPLLRGRFEITELIVDKPVFTLAKQPEGSISRAGGDSKRPSAGDRRDGKTQPPAPRGGDRARVPVIIPGRMTIRDGQLAMGAKGLSPLKISGIDLSLQDFSGDRPFPFRASFDYPGLKNISLEGHLDYRPNESLLKLTEARLKIQNLSLPVEGFVSHLSSAPRLHLNIDGDNFDSRPILQILSPLGLAPPDTEVSGPMSLQVSVSGPLTGPSAQVRGRFNGLKVNGKRALKAHLTGEVSLRLPFGEGSVVRRLEGVAKLSARDGELTHLKLVEKIHRAAGMIGLSRDQRREATTFRRLETQFIIGGGYAEFTRLYLVNRQMEINGDGIMTLEKPTLDMVIRTALSTQASARAGRGQTVARLKDRRGRIVVPLKVTGPVENPTVNLNAQAMPATANKNFDSLVSQLMRNR